MQVGELDRRISIEERVLVKDIMNHDTVTWTERVECWAKVTHKGGRDIEAGKQTVEVDRVEFLLRYNSEIETTDRVVHDGNNYGILSIDVFGMRNEWLRLTCSTRDNGSN